MTRTPSTRKRAIVGVAGALAAIAVAIPAVSAADRGHGSGHDGDRGETVGTISSFDEATGTLTIAPTTGDPVSGMVTDRTKIQCRNDDADDDNGDDHGDDGPNHDIGDDHGDDGPNHDIGDDHGDDHHGDGHGGPGQGKRSHGGHRGNCDTDALVVGAEVEDADLDLGSTGLTFEEVELR